MCDVMLGGAKGEEVQPTHSPGCNFGKCLGTGGGRQPPCREGPAPCLCEAAPARVGNHFIELHVTSPTPQFPPGAQQLHPAGGRAQAPQEHSPLPGDPLSRGTSPTSPPRPLQRQSSPTRKRSPHPCKPPRSESPPPTPSSGETPPPQHPTKSPRPRRRQPGPFPARAGTGTRPPPQEAPGPPLPDPRRERRKLPGPSGEGRSGLSPLPPAAELPGCPGAALGTAPFLSPPAPGEQSPAPRPLTCSIAAAALPSAERSTEEKNERLSPRPLLF